MQRLFLVLLVIAVVLALGYALTSLASRLKTEGGDNISAGSPMQRIAFLLLAALMVYVAFAGAS